MNKKGYGTDMMIFVFVIVLVCVILAMSESGVDTKTIDSTINSLNWSKYYENVSISITSAGEDSPYWVQSVLEICNKGIDFIGYAIFTVAKLAMIVAKNNPDMINYKVLLGLVVLALIAPIIYPAFVIIVSIILIIKEWLTLRKERKAKEMK